MLLLKIFFTTYQPSPDKGRLTCYELISYPFEIIIGLQKYGFSLNWQTISSFFWIYQIEIQAYRSRRNNKKESEKPRTKLDVFVRSFQLVQLSKLLKIIFFLIMLSSLHKYDCQPLSLLDRHPN